MTIIIANKIHKRIRGVLKTWFAEPKENVFISNINNQLASRIINMCSTHFKECSGMLIIQSTNNFLGYKIIKIGKCKQDFINISGLDLFLE